LEDIGYWKSLKLFLHPLRSPGVIGDGAKVPPQKHGAHQLILTSGDHDHRNLNMEKMVAIKKKQKFIGYNHII